jgi:hypothetical protein
MISPSKWIAGLSFSFCALTSIVVQADCKNSGCSLTSNTLEKDKIYLIPGSLCMDESSLFVNFEGELYPVKQVSTDERGIYIDAREFENSKYGFWTCPQRAS